MKPKLMSTERESFRTYSEPSAPAVEKPRIGVSACLLGHSVRYNGGHKRHDWLVDIFANHVTYVPFCPEMAMGLGTPRDTLRLVSEPGSKVPRMISSRDQRDLTEQAHQTAQRLLAPDWNIDAFILKRDSPSCGLERVRVYNEHGIPERDGVGIFARTLKALYPRLPILEEGRLSDPAQRENFVTRVYASHRFGNLLREIEQHGSGIAALQEFHQRYKLLLMAHSPLHYQRLGQIVGNARRLPAEEVLALYREPFFDALQIPVTPGKQANVLQHVLGYLKNQLDEKEKRQILEAVSDFQAGLLPFVAPLSLLHHLVRKFSMTYLEQQFFFRPYPKDLVLRNSG